MRVSRLVEVLLRLQVHGGAPASELAAAFGVSVRAIYRDVEALCAAGVPIYTDIGRHGGIRIDPAYRVAGLPRLATDQARGVLFAVIPAAGLLGFDAAAVERTLLPAMDVKAEHAARAVHERLLIEPTHWFLPPDEPSALATVATGVWESRELRLDYRGATVVVRPFGLILKGSTWYVLAGMAGSPASLRLFRLSRIDAVDVLEHRFERPAGFDLAAQWAQQRRAFLESLPQYFVTVRVHPDAEPMLGVLDEGAPDLPLPADVERDEHGWARLRLRFERDADGVARQLLQLGAEVEVLEPPELRERLAGIASGLAELYRRRD